MKIYEIFSIHPSMETLEFAYIPRESPWYENKLNWGEEITEKKELPIKYIYKHKSDVRDWPATSNGGMLVSLRYADVLKRLTKHYQIFPAEVDNKGDIIKNEYVSFVFTTNFPAISWEHTECRNLDGFADSVLKLIVSSEKIKSIPASEQVFRMAENSIWLLATEDGLKAIEDAGILDVGFGEIEVV